MYTASFSLDNLMPDPILVMAHWCLSHALNQRNKKLVGGLDHEIYFSIQLGMSSSQLTHVIIPTGLQWNSAQDSQMMITGLSVWWRHGDILMAPCCFYLIQWRVHRPMLGYVGFIMLGCVGLPCWNMLGKNYLYFDYLRLIHLSPHPRWRTMCGDWPNYILLFFPCEKQNLAPKNKHFQCQKT